MLTLATLDPLVLSPASLGALWLLLSPTVGILLNYAAEDMPLFVNPAPRVAAICAAALGWVLAGAWVFA